MFTRNGFLLKLLELIILGNDQQEIVSRSMMLVFPEEKIRNLYLISNQIKNSILNFLSYVSDSLYLYLSIWTRLGVQIVNDLYFHCERNFHAFSFIFHQHFSVDVGQPRLSRLRTQNATGCIFLYLSSVRWLMVGIYRMYLHQCHPCHVSCLYLLWLVSLHPWHFDTY